MWAGRMRVLRGGGLFLLLVVAEEGGPGGCLGFERKMDDGFSVAGWFVIGDGWRMGESVRRSVGVE